MSSCWPPCGGKTTLLKVMLGLFRPTGREVLVDGVPLDHIDPTAFRAQVDVVMQEDQLLTGSLMENIALDVAREREVNAHPPWASPVSSSPTGRKPSPRPTGC